MNNFKASYILNIQEMGFLLNDAAIGGANFPMSHPAQFLFASCVERGTDNGAEDGNERDAKSGTDSGAEDGKDSSAESVSCVAAGRNSDVEYAVNGLIYKNLARKVSGSLVLAPVVTLLVETILSSDALWIISSDEARETVFVLKSNKLALHIQRYAHIPNTWKITPYQSIELLSEEFRGEVITSAIRIDKNGAQKRCNVINLKHGKDVLFV